MTRSKTISVTDNVEYCIKILKKAVKSLPDGDLKNEANGATTYLDKIVLKGETQPKRGKWCPPGVKVKPPPPN